MLLLITELCMKTTVYVKIDIPEQLLFSEAIVRHNKKLAVDESAEDSECKVPRVLQ